MAQTSGTHNIRRVILPLIVSIALIEALIMLLFHVLRLGLIIPPLLLDFGDAILLSLITSLLIFFWIVRPLKLLEERFRRILESSPDGLLIANSAREIIMTNKVLQTMTGYSREELLNQPVEKLVPIGIGARRAEASMPAPGNRDIYCRRRDGTLFPAEIKLNPLATDEGELTVVAIQDITDRERTVASLRLAAAVFANTTEGIVVTNTSGKIESVNEAFVQITGYSEEDALGKNIRLLKSGMHDEDFYRELWTSLNETGTWKGRIWNRRKNGEFYPQETTINAIRDAHGEVSRYCSIFRDVTVQTKLEEQLHVLSTTDGLTGLANRRTFDDMLLIEWRRSQRVHYPVALVLADIDNFKRYNDTYGHVEGDECLKTVGGVFKNAVRRAGDLAARYGGEEIVLLLPMTTSEEAAQIADDIRTKIHALNLPHETNKPRCIVTVSFGVAAVSPHQTMPPEELIVMADKALYEAKRQGKDRVVTAGHGGK